MIFECQRRLGGFLRLRIFRRDVIQRLALTGVIPNLAVDLQRAWDRFLASSSFPMSPSTLAILSIAPANPLWFPILR